MKNSIFTTVAVTASYSVFATTPAQDLNVLEDRLLRLYDSSEQSLYQPSYFDVTLRHCRLKVTDIPKEKQDHRFLVVEQSMSLHQDRPYRVRLVELGVSKEGKLTSTNYQLQNADTLVGACTEEKNISYAVFPQAKCTIFLEKVGDKFVGGTPDTGCASNYNNADYFTNELTIGDGFISSWDRGFSQDGTQVWGAVQGPYLFRETTAADQAPDVVEMASYLIGHSTNEEQVAADPSFANIDYSICPMKVEGWTSHRNRIFYEEQKISFESRSIVRARAYAMYKQPGQDILFKAYELTDEEALRGFCETDRPVNEVVPRNMIQWDEECEMNFQPSSIFSDKYGFLGMTQPGGCLSEFRGSRYLTITSLLTRESYNIWERWWDAENKQVAGAQSGPYIYKRKNHYWYSLKND